MCAVTFRSKNSKCLTSDGGGDPWHCSLGCRPTFGKVTKFILSASNLCYHGLHWLGELTDRKQLVTDAGGGQTAARRTVNMVILEISKINQIQFISQTPQEFFNWHFLKIYFPVFSSLPYNREGEWKGNDNLGTFLKILQGNNHLNTSERLLINSF